MTYQINNNGGNYTRVGIIQRDEDGNALACPHCGSTHLIKAGDCGTHKRKQRWKCRTCGKKTVSPKAVKNYDLEQVEDTDWSTEELINQRTEELARLLNAMAELLYYHYKSLFHHLLFFL